MVERRGVGARTAAAALVALLVSGCGSYGAYTKEGGATSPLPLQAVDWNPSKTPVDAAFLADAGDQTAFFGPSGVTVMAGGAVLGSSASPGMAWQGAAALPAADGLGTWMVGITTTGALYRARGDASLEAIGGRYGLARSRVVAAAQAGGATVAFLTDWELVVADGKTVKRYAVGPRTLLAAGGNVIAVAGNDDVLRMDAISRAADRFALPGVRSLAVDARGTVFAATAHELYAATPRASLALRYAGRTLGNVVASGDRVWFEDDGHLATLETRSVGVAGAGVAGGARLVAAPGGEVWLSVPGATPQKVAHEGSTPAGRWTASIQPIFARSCASCHLPGGASGIDLSNYARWELLRGTILERVVVEKTMPPLDHALAEVDREALKAWLEKR